MLVPDANKKAVFLIDGFNFYHSLVNPKFRPRLAKYKWVNLSKLCALFLQPQDKLKDIYYFTALCSWNQNKSDRHKIFIQALENTGVKVVMGKFKEVTKRCRGTCKQEFKTHEEKRTDVNIGVTLVRMAFQDNFDIAYILSADSDLVPAIEEVKSLFPQKEVVVIVPFGNCADELKAVCNSNRKIKEKHLSTSLFDKEIILPTGDKLSCPIGW